MGPVFSLGPDLFFENAVLYLRTHDTSIPNNRHIHRGDILQIQKHLWL